MTAKEKKELQALKRKCYHLWNKLVKDKAGNKCEHCGKTKRLNAHHIEGYITNKGLRYEARNGLCLCPRCHKFGWFSAHNSFVFMYLIMTEKRLDDLLFLIEMRGKKVDLTKNYLENKINELLLSSMKKRAI